MNSRQRAFLIAAGLCLALGCAAAGTKPADVVELSRADETSAGACFPAGPEQCYNAFDDNCNGLIDEGCGTPGGLVHIAISWREPEVDVDLDVIGPDGKLVEAEKVLENGLTKLRDCPGDDNSCRGLNTEHVVLEAEHAVPVGMYTVRVRLENARGAEPPIQVRVAGRLGPKSYSSEVDLVAEKDEHELHWEL